MTEPSVWFAHASGEQHGPLSREALLAMARDGTLRPDDLVWESGTPSWVRAAEAIPFGVEEPSPSLAPPPPPPPPPPSAAVRFAAPRKPAALLARVADDFDSFEAAELFPFGRVADPEVLGVPSTWLLLLFGLAPLFVGSVVEDPALRVRLFRLGLGAAWTVFLVTAFRTERPSLRLGISVFSAGALLAALLVTVLPGVPPLSWAFALTAPAHAGPVRFLGFLLGAGFVAEGLKLLALVLLARAVGGIADARDGAFFGLVTGAGFGLWEAAAVNELAAPRHGGLLALVTAPSTGLEAIFVSSVARAIAVPALEAAWGGVAGYYAGLASSRGAPSVLGLGLLLAALLHAACETFRAADQGFAALVVAAVSLLLFLCYQRR